MYEESEDVCGRETGGVRSYRSSTGICEGLMGSLTIQLAESLLYPCNRWGCVMGRNATACMGKARNIYKDISNGRFVVLFKKANFKFRQSFETEAEAIRVRDEQRRKYEMVKRNGMGNVAVENGAAAVNNINGVSVLHSLVDQNPAMQGLVALLQGLMAITTQTVVVPGARSTALPVKAEGLSAAAEKHLKSEVVAEEAAQPEEELSEIKGDDPDKHDDVDMDQDQIGGDDDTLYTLDSKVPTVVKKEKGTVKVVKTVKKASPAKKGKGKGRNGGGRRAAKISLNVVTRPKHTHIPVISPDFYYFKK